MRLLRQRATVAVLVLCLACGSATTEPATLSGSWVSGSWAMTLSQTNGAVSGAGHAPYYNALAGGTVSTAITITGSATSSSFSLTLTAQGYQPVNLSGSLQSNQLAGMLNGGGWTNSPITFTRQ